MELGLQLFGCMPYYNSDPDAFCERVAKAGYTMLEPCIMYGDREMPFAWSFAKLKEHAERARRHGLKLHSCHVFSRDILADMPRILETAEMTDIRCFTDGIRFKPEKDSIDRFCDTLSAAGETLGKNGCEMWLHNSMMEIETRINGVSVYELVLNAVDSCYAQVDTGWAVRGGEDLPQMLGRLGSKVHAIHHKDIAMIKGEDGHEHPVNTAIGKGYVDSAAAYAFAVKNGLVQYVDQDDSQGDFMEDTIGSARFLLSLGSAR